MSNADRYENPGKPGGNTGPRNPIEAKGRTQTQLSLLHLSTMEFLSLASMILWEHDFPKATTYIY